MTLLSEGSAHNERTGQRITLTSINIHALIGAVDYPQVCRLMILKMGVYDQGATPPNFLPDVSGTDGDQISNNLYLLWHYGKNQALKWNVLYNKTFLMTNNSAQVGAHQHPAMKSLNLNFKFTAKTGLVTYAPNVNGRVNSGDVIVLFWSDSLPLTTHPTIFMSTRVNYVDL